VPKEKYSEPTPRTKPEINRPPVITSIMGVLLGERERMLAQAKRIAENGDAAVARAPGQRRGHHTGDGIRP